MVGNFGCPVKHCLDIRGRDFCKFSMWGEGVINVPGCEKFEKIKFHPHPCTIRHKRVMDHRSSEMLSQINH